VTTARSLDLSVERMPRSSPGWMAPFLFEASARIAHVIQFPRHRHATESERGGRKNGKEKGPRLLSGSVQPGPYRGGGDSKMLGDLGVGRWCLKYRSRMT
jgi:hypothetical protein